MAKKTIRLTEGDLHSIIKESVKNVLKENDDFKNPSEIAYGLMVMIGDIQNDYMKGEEPITIEEIDELYGMAVQLNDYFASQNDINESRNINKKRMIKESVNNILNEIGDTHRGQELLGRLAYRKNEEKPIAGKNIGKMKKSKDNPIFSYATKRQKENGMNLGNYMSGYKYEELLDKYENEPSKNKRLSLVGTFIAMCRLKNFLNMNQKSEIRDFLNGRTIETLTDEELDYLVYNILRQ